MTVSLGAVAGVAVFSFSVGVLLGRRGGRRTFRRRLGRNLDVLGQIARENSEEYRLGHETTADYLREEFDL